MLFHTRLVSIAVILIGFAAFSSTASESNDASQDFYTAYQNVLSEFVDDEGMVDYAGLNEDPSELNAFLEGLGSLPREIFDSWSEDEQIAFYINVYNAYTLKAIIDHYPIKASWFGSLRFPDNSIRQISGVWTELKWPVMGREMTLDQIEHETLRVDYNEPRIHFAVNCASMGCPLLHNEPYLGETLDAQLDAQVERFLQRDTDFQLKRESKTVKLSKILDWYGGDFAHYAGAAVRFDYLGENERGVMNFLYPYLNEEQQAFLNENRIDIDYIDYDWSLNER